MNVQELKKKHFAMTWTNYPEWGASCYWDRELWPCDIGHVLAALAASEARVARLKDALPDPSRLELLADWIDLKYPDEPKHRGDVQYDLRSWAQRIRVVRAEAALEAKP